LSATTPHPSLTDLRKKLREKFPAAHRNPPPAELEEKPFNLIETGFPRGSLNEIITEKGALLISELLNQERDLPLALIDGRDSFDPASHGSSKCTRLFWIRCHDAMQGVKCADLLLRDGNLPLVLLDLHRNPERELRRIPKSVWHRLRTEARDTGSTLLALNKIPLLPSPAVRIFLNTSFSLDHLEWLTPTLTVTPEATQVRQRIQRH